MSFGSSSRRLMQKSLESPRLNSRFWLMWDSRVNFSSSSILSLCFSIFGVPTCQYSVLAMACFLLFILSRVMHVMFSSSIFNNVHAFPMIIFGNV